MANYLQLSATTQVKVGAGSIKGLIVSSTSSGTLTFYDSDKASTSDPKIIDTLTPDAGSTLLNITPGVWFNKGLYIVVGGTIQFTIVYE